MGQYYKPISVDKKQHLYSHNYGSGLKLMEHSYIDNPLCNAVIGLLKKGQPWHKTRIVWAGDYGEMSFKDFPTTPNEELVDALELKEGENLYQQIGDANRLKVSPKKHRNVFLLNWNTKEFVDFSKVKLDAEGWGINPLPLLTADGNGSGGGDYSGSSESYVGSWAGHVLSVETKAQIPKDFVELYVEFKEGGD